MVKPVLYSLSSNANYSSNKTSTPREILLSPAAAVIASDVNFLFENAQKLCLAIELNPEEIAKLDAEIFKEMEKAVARGQAISLGKERIDNSVSNPKRLRS